MKKQLNYILGILLLLLGIYLSVFQGEPRFFTPFSIGLSLILYSVYNSMYKKSLFDKWNVNQYVFFVIVLVVSCIIIDKLGLYLDYWIYPYSITSFVQIIMYTLEWALPFFYIMLTFFIGTKVFQRFNISKKYAEILSLLTFVIFIGIFTEYINHFSNSWIILKMPITSYKIGNFFLIFQTIGYWLMAMITTAVYEIVEKLRK